MLLPQQLVESLHGAGTVKGLDVLKCLKMKFRNMIISNDWK